MFTFANKQQPTQKVTVYHAAVLTTLLYLLSKNVLECTSLAKTDLLLSVNALSSCHYQYRYSELG